MGRKPANPHECSLFSAHFWFLKVGKTRANGHFFAVFSGFPKKENGQNIHKTRKKWAKAHFSKQKWADNIHYFYSFFTCPEPSENCSTTVSSSLQSAPDRYEFYSRLENIYSRLDVVLRSRRQIRSGSLFSPVFWTIPQCEQPHLPAAAYS